MNVAEAVGRALVANGADHAFGVVGSGNFHVTNALVAAGGRYVAAVHEGGAASMADGYARTSGRLAVLTVHQGPGLTNALTGITEAAKSRTPLIVLAPEATNPRSNFHLDLAGIAAAVGAGLVRVGADQPAADVAAACRAAREGAGRTVLLALPLDVQTQPALTPPKPQTLVNAPALSPKPETLVNAAGRSSEPETLVNAPGRSSEAQTLVNAAGRSPEPQTLVNAAGVAAEVGALVDALRAARRPVFIGGRGATRDGDARAALTDLAERCGALLAVSAAAKGLFAGDPWNLDVSGGFATPLAAELIGRADLVVAWGSTLNMWTTRHGRLIGPDAVVAQVDLDPAALGVNRAVNVGVTGDVTAVARACTAALVLRGTPHPAAPDAAAAESEPAARAGGWRTAEVRERIGAEGRWRDVSYVDDSAAGRIDPRTLSIALDDLLPAERTVVVDSGNFMGYPSMFLAVPDRAGFLFTQAFQSIGLGLAGGLGAAVARPDRLTVVATGDGGLLMGAAELATAARLGAPLLVVVYDDAAYGAEVHHFGPDGHPLDTVLLGDRDLAAIGRGYGCEGAIVRTAADLQPVAEWLAGDRARPLVVDAKITSRRGAWWLEEAFRGH